MARPFLVTGRGLDPYENLALEEALMEAVEPGEAILYLWQNEHTVVIGKNQNAWKECRVEELERSGGHLARRSSGGGAVYHDRGNLNFSFVACDDDFDVERHIGIVCRAVRSFGIDARVNGRNDLTAEGAKFSGHAFCNRGIRHVHHGTLMVDVDFASLARYLVPDAKKLAAKGVSSVRARVENLSALSPDITVETLSRALEHAFAEEHGVPVETFPARRIDEAALASHRNRLASWDWRLGASAPFSHRFSERWAWGGLDIELRAERGIVQDARLFSDAMDAEYVEEMARAMRGCPFGRESLVDRARSLPARDALQETMRDDFAELLDAQFSGRREHAASNEASELTERHGARTAD